MKLYVVRHGQTNFNLKHIMQGTIDNDLNQNGINQIEKVAEKLKDVKFDICFSSPLIRARKTLEIITKQDYIVDNRLIERGLGVFEAKESETYDKVLYWDYDKNSSFGGVEPIKSIEKRIQEFLVEIEEKYDDKTVLVVSHDAPIRMMNYLIKGFDNDTNFLDLKLENGCILEYDI